MPLPYLLNVPKTQEDWDIWAFNLRKQNEQTRQAIQRQSGGATILFEYQLNPINFNDIKNWQQRNQEALDDINQTLNLQGSDVSSVDLTDKAQLESFIYTVYSQYRNAAVALKI